jgi:GntR family transcriptional repressor for pyruvate dehydrogenase complex
VLPVSAVSLVAERLMEYFTTGQVPAGTRLPPERQLAASLQVGRSAVREALAALELLGLVVVRPGSGTYLRDAESELLPRTLSWGVMLGEERTRQLIELRASLEIQAAELAVEKMSAASLSTLGGFLRDMENNRHDLPAFVAADSGFHREIAQGSGNVLLQNLLQTSRALLRLWVDRALSDQEHAEVALREHREVYEALVARDAAAVGAAMGAHMVTASKRLFSDFQAARS